MSNASCVVSKFSHYLPLTVDEEALIRRLEGVERTFDAGEIIRREGAEVAELFLIKHGWVALSSDLDDGKRQVFDLQFPGDNEFDLPLGQELIGDALGLSQVHVIRTFREREEQGLIKRCGRCWIRVDARRLKGHADFSDRYYRFDTSWAPAPGANQ